MTRKEKIIELRNSGKTLREIGIMFNISRSRVSQIERDRFNLDKMSKLNIIIRDGGKCTLCDSKENLQIHHIDHDSHNNFGYNLVTLCRKCHRYNTRWRRTYR